VLARPLDAFSVLHNFDRFFDIAQRWWFNPLGSTMCGLRLFDAGELDTRLVSVAWFHEPWCALMASHLNGPLGRTKQGVRLIAAAWPPRGKQSQPIGLPSIDLCGHGHELRSWRWFSAAADLTRGSPNAMDGRCSGNALLKAFAEGS
jgi:hypothetical protein